MEFRGGRKQSGPSILHFMLIECTKLLDTSEYLHGAPWSIHTPYNCLLTLFCAFV